MNASHDDTFAVVVSALGRLLADGTERCAEAHGYTLQHERNAAVGTLLGLEDVLTDALALYRVALLLHRRSGP